MEATDLDDQVVEVENMNPDAVGPVMRAGEIAEAMIGAIAEDNAPKKVFVLDRGDYIRINTLGDCKLTLKTLESHLGREYNLARLEIEMPSFSGRIRTTDAEYVWFNDALSA